MATVHFTENLKKHLDCPSIEVSADNLKDVLQAVEEFNPQLVRYILDDQGQVRKHILIAIDNQFITDKANLYDKVNQDSEIYIMQALSGG